MKTFERVLVELTASLCRLFGVTSVELENHRARVDGQPSGVFKGSRRPE